MITSIIFSKNRPLQLDLCLNSLNKNFPECNKKIVIENNSEDFKSSYEILKKEHEDVEFWRQSRSLFRDVYNAIVSCGDDYICFFTDDIIFYRKSEKINYDNIFLIDAVCCISLRMGNNIYLRQHGEDWITDKPISQLYDIEGMIGVPRTANFYGGYWSYSLSVDGHVFRKKDILAMMDELCYLDEKYEWPQTPNELESALQRFWTTTPSIMVCPTHSCVVNSPNNRVQQSAPNRCGDVFNYDEYFLLGKYMGGSRICIDYLDFSEIKCPHTELDILKGVI